MHAIINNYYLYALPHERDSMHYMHCMHEIETYCHFACSLYHAIVPSSFKFAFKYTLLQVTEPLIFSHGLFFIWSFCSVADPEGAALPPRF